jgi:hypothetical protein
MIFPGLVFIHRTHIEGTSNQHRTNIEGIPNPHRTNSLSLGMYFTTKSCFKFLLYRDQKKGTHHQLKSILDFVL